MERAEQASDTRDATGRLLFLGGVAGLERFTSLPDLGKVNGAFEDDGGLGHIEKYLQLLCYRVRKFWAFKAMRMVPF